MLLGIYTLTDPGNFYGIVSNDDYNGDYPEIWNLGMIYFRYGNTSYAYRVVINSKGGKTSIPRAVPTPLKVDRARKYDIKGRSMKSRPNYGVYF